MLYTLKNPHSHSPAVLTPILYVSHSDVSQTIGLCISFEPQIKETIAASCHLSIDDYIFEWGVHIESDDWFHLVKEQLELDSLKPKHAADLRFTRCDKLNVWIQGLQKEIPLRDIHVTGLSFVQENYQEHRVLANVDVKLKSVKQPSS